MFYINKNSNKRNLTLKERPYCIKHILTTIKGWYPKGLINSLICFAHWFFFWIQFFCSINSYYMIVQMIVNEITRTN
jgi:hypothetical protein